MSALFFKLIYYGAGMVVQLLLQEFSMTDPDSNLYLDNI